MPKYNNLLKQKGYAIKKIEDTKLVNDIIKIVKKHFKKSNKYYCEISLINLGKLHSSAKMKFLN